MTLLSLDQGPEMSAAIDLFRRLHSEGLRRRRHRARLPRESNDGISQPFGSGRDPQSVGVVLNDMTHDLGWTSFLLESDVLSAWPEIAGPDVAARTSAEGVKDGALVVSCESTAWATQLRLLSPEIVTRLTEAFPDANITALVVRGPDQPTWRHGARTLPGRGPRDTYA